MVRIALISDVHFGKFSRSNDFSVPGEYIKDENDGEVSLKDSMIKVLINNEVQYICIAGDLTSIGSPQEFIFFEKTILSIAKEIGISQERIILGLGNHDTDWKISKLCDDYIDKSVSDSKFLIDLVKEKYRLIAASTSVHYIENIPEPDQKGPAPFSGIVENDDFVMFILNSGWYCTHDQLFPHGKLNSDQIDWFEFYVKKYQEDKRWKIVLMHHHPFNYSYHKPGIDISTLEEGSTFLDLAGQYGIHLVLHGHRHHPRAETTSKNEWKHPITFVCSGSLAVNASHRSNGEIPNTLHIIELNETPGILTLYNYLYSSSQGWLLIKQNCPETPLDAKMMLGKLFEEDEINRSINSLPSKKTIKWNDLDDCLRFLPINSLNKKIKKLRSDEYNIVGHFPDNVFLFKKGDKL